MRTRRWMLISGLSAAGCAFIDRHSGSGHALLDEAIAAAGGSDALSRARVLAWTGEASVFAADKRTELGVDTVVEPFRYARSITWLRDQGRATERTLKIDGEKGWLIKEGTRSPMPEATLRHEREQYALYGLMRLVTLREPGVSIESLQVAADGARGLRARHPSGPTTEFWFSRERRLLRATNRVDAPDGSGFLDQLIKFDGQVRGAGVLWPRALNIFQADKPYFELRISSFDPRERR